VKCCSWLQCLNGRRDLAVGTPALYTSNSEFSLLANDVIKTLGLRKEILFVLKTERNVRTIGEGNTESLMVGPGDGGNFFSFSVSAARAYW
jgi:hypothetical protein